MIANLFIDVGKKIQSALSVAGLLDGEAVSVSFASSPATTFDFADPLTPSEVTDLVNQVLSADEFWFTIPVHKTLSVPTPDVELGLDFFKLAITDPVTITLDVDFEISLGVSLDDGFFLQFDPNEKDLSVELKVALPTNVQGRLFFLELNASDDNTVDELLGFFKVDVKGTDTQGRIGFSKLATLDFDVDFEARADIDLGLNLGLASNVGTGFPSVLAELDLNWGSALAAVGLNANDYPLNPLVKLDNLGIDLGTFISDVIGPFLGKIDEYLGPVGDVIDVVTDPIPVLSDLWARLPCWMLPLPLGTRIRAW